MRLNNSPIFYIKQGTVRDELVLIHWHIYAHVFLQISMQRYNLLTFWRQIIHTRGLICIKNTIIIKRNIYWF